MALKKIDGLKADQIYKVKAKSVGCGERESSWKEESFKTPAYIGEN